MLEKLGLASLSGLLIAALRYPRSVTAAIVVGAVAALLLADQRRDQFIWLTTKETGPLERCTVLGFLLAGAAFTLAFFRRRGRPGRGWLLLLALICVVIACEEVSWGQHVFGFAPPETVAHLNLQKELNIHNVFSSQLSNLLFLLGLFILFIVAPVALANPQRAPLALRAVISLPILFVLLHLVQGRLQPEYGWEFEPFRPVLWGTVAATLFLVALFARPILGLSPVVRCRESFARAVSMRSPLLACALIFVGLWLVYGLRFGSLWDLRFYQTGYLINTDDELIEFLGAVLFVMLAGMQFGPRPEGVRSREEQVSRET